MFDRFIQIKDEEPKYLGGKNKKKKRVLPKAGSYTVKDLEEPKKKVATYQGGLK